MTAPAMKPSEALRAARELLTPEGVWIQGEYARDKDGYMVWPWEDAAVCFCSLGALERVSGEDDFSKVADQGAQYLRSAMGCYAVDWQDIPTRTHTEVLDAFDRAIALAESEGW